MDEKNETLTPCESVGIAFHDLVSVELMSYVVRGREAHSSTASLPPSP